VNWGDENLRRATRRSDSETGSGSVLALGIVGGVAAALTLIIPLYTGLGIRESVSDAADASALAGADVAAGIAPGFPCAVAAETATANRAQLVRCSVDGLVVTVITNDDFLGLSLRSTATAGPPVVGTN
jgi:secretion/DNA translocation related TadE-like protein